jgi:S1-C subfamily serine protease
VYLVGWSSLPMLINDAPIEHGSSGSPLLNEDGKLEGVAYAGDDDTGRQYAVPVEVLIEVITSPKGFDKTAACDGVPQAVVPDGATRCSATVYAGVRTSCPFALEVEQSWTRAGGGDADIIAHSPVTKLDYRLSCADGEPVVCTATTGATVYIQK